MQAGDDAFAGESRPSLLDQLSPDQRRILAYASAIGREIDFPLLAAAIGTDEEILAEELERMQQLGVVRERAGGDRFHFVQDEVRARVYRSLTQARLRVLHRKIGDAMERLYPDAPQEIVPELGRHYFLGRVPEKSYAYNRRAAEFAESNDDPEESAQFLERARIDLPQREGDHRAELAELDERLGNLYASMGDSKKADRVFAEGLDLAARNAHELRARLLLARAEAARDLHENARAIALGREAMTLFERTTNLEGVASVHRILGRIAFNDGAYAEALEQAMLALDLLQRTGDRDVLGRLCTDIGNTFSMLGPHVREDAVQWYERAIDLLLETGDLIGVARAELNLGMTIGETRPADGLDSLSKGREYAERAHELRLAGWALFAGVEMRLALGQVEEAERDNQQAGRLLERADDPTGRQQVAANSGLIAEKRGQWEEAERSYQLAIQQAEELGAHPEIAEAQYYLARLYFKTRSMDRAREMYRLAGERDLPRLRPHLARPFRELGRQLDPAETPTGPPAGTPA